MRRELKGQAHSAGEDFTFLTHGQPTDIVGVIAGFDAGLDRLPIAHWEPRAIADQQRRRRYGLTNACVGSGYEEAAHIESFLSANARAATKSSRIGSLKLELTDNRKRDVPI